MVLSGVEDLIKHHGVEHILGLSGHPSWSFVLIKDVEPYTQWQIKTLFLQEMFDRGILMLGSHNMSYAHSDDDIAALLVAYEQVLPIIKDAVVNGQLESHLRCEPLEPLFKVR